MIEEKDVEELENRFADLKFKVLKKKLGMERYSISPKKPEAGRWELRVTTQKDGQMRRVLRMADGSSRVLSADRSSWPSDVREATEKFEEYDRSRTRNGRMFATAV